MSVSLPVEVRLPLPAAVDRHHILWSYAGTLVVWDVDPQAETVAVYRATDPTQAKIYRRGETAEAVPAVPNWRMNVDEIFAG